MSRSANAIDLRSNDDSSHVSTHVSSHDAADESGEHTVMVETKRLTAFDLEKVLAAEAAAAKAAGDDAGANDDGEPEPTVALSVDANLRFMSQAFRSSDDEITLEAPVFPIPGGVPSPLGDDVQAEPAPVTKRASALMPELTSLFGDADGDEGRGAVEAPELLAPEALISKVSGIRQCVSPERARVAREARDAARIISEEERKTRLLVIGIWGAAVTLSGLLAFFAMTP